MKIIKTVALVACFAAFSACVNDDIYQEPDLSGLCNDIPVNKTVAETFTGVPSYPGYSPIYPTDDVIEGYVTSSDEGGTFYKSISIVSTDGAIGFSVPVDNYNLYNTYEPGRKVFVRLKDRYLTKDNGNVVGSLYNNNTPEVLTDDEVGRISGVEYQKVLIRSCTKVDEETLVNHLTIAQTKNDANLNKLIELDNVQFTDASIGKKYFDPSLNNLGGATNHLVADAAGNTIIVRISEFAVFSGKMIPTENGKIRGVLTKFGSDYQFLPRTENDIKLGGARVVPVFEETFTSNFPIWTKFSVTGPQTWTLDTTFGNPGSCAKMSGFSGGNIANEDWLISPAIDMTDLTSAALTFQTATKFAGPQLQTLISTNYSGTGNPSAATWTTLSATYSPSTGSYIWTNSGQIDISAFGGSTVHIAYKYTSTTAAAATWEVDNVKIIGN